MVLALAAWRVQRPAALPVLGSVPDFHLTERSGDPFGTADVAGHVWIAAFIFTRCPDVCPALSARLAELQKELPQAADPVRLVSFSVDPVHDSPEVLTAYATRFRAGASWLFVTGPRAEVAGLLRDGFRLAFADDGPATNPITHSDRFVLVDRARRIRGYYHGSDTADLARLARDADRLRAEPPSA